MKGPVTKSFVTCLVSDIHIPHHMRAEWRAFRLWHADAKPDRTIIGGDFMDLAPLSTFDKDPAQSMCVIPEIQEFVREANALADECGELHIIEGNHEERWARRMKDISQQLYGAIGLTLREQCYAQGLTRRAHWHAETAAWRGIDEAQVLVRHGHKDAGRYGGGKHVAANLLEKTHRSITVGHHHTVQMFCRRTDDGTLKQATCNGTFEQPAEFMPSNPWVYGFTIYERCSPEWTTIHPIVIEKGLFAYGGKVYNGNAPEVRKATYPPASDVPLEPHHLADYPATFDTDPGSMESDRVLGALNLPPPPAMPKEERNTRGAAGDRLRMIYHPGLNETRSLADWARKIGRSRNTLAYRLDRVQRDPEYTIEQALTPEG